MMFTAFFSIVFLTFWSAVTASQDLQSEQADTTIPGYIAPNRQVYTDMVAGGELPGLADNSLAYNLNLNASGHNPPQKDLRLSCSKFSLYLSKEKPITYYLIATCGNLYDEPHGVRCSYLDLDLCFANIDGRIKPARLGSFSGTCYDCEYYTTMGGSNMLRCDCDQGHDEDHLIRNDINLDETLYPKNGFLSCFGITNFVCPDPGEAPI